MRLFSTEHLALLELQSKHGPIVHRRYGVNPEDKPLKYLSDWVLTSLANSGFVTKTEVEHYVHEVKITEAGIEELRKQADPKARRYRFSINDASFESKFWFMVAGVEDQFTSFEKLCLIAHNGLSPSGKLTKASEKWATRNIVKFITSRLGGNTTWLTAWGPNKLFWMRNNVADFSDWERTLEWDHRLLRAIPGVGSILLPDLPSANVDYAKILLTSPTLESAKEKIKEYQLRDPESFPFCPLPLVEF